MPTVETLVTVDMVQISTARTRAVVLAALAETVAVRRAQELLVTGAMADLADSVDRDRSPAARATVQQVAWVVRAALVAQPPQVRRVTAAREAWVVRPERALMVQQLRHWVAMVELVVPEEIPVPVAPEDPAAARLLGSTVTGAKVATAAVRPTGATAAMVLWGTWTAASAGPVAMVGTQPQRALVELAVVPVTVATVAVRTVERAQLAQAPMAATEATEATEVLLRAALVQEL